MKKIILLLSIMSPFFTFGQCQEGEIPIYMSTTSGEWAYEMSWGLWDYETWMEGNPNENNSIASYQGQENFENIIIEGCLPSTGCYMIAGYDSYGDGWNGGTLEVSVNYSKTPETYELSNGTWGYWSFEIGSKECSWEIPGCTDPQAANFNDLATIDNGTCIIPSFFEWDNEQREYFLYIPETLQDDAPLVFVLHGYWGEGADMIGLLSEQAYEHGFVVCYPTGLPDSMQGANHWNANFNSNFSNVDDVGFLTNLASFLQEEYNLNSEETFSCGMSNGGYMSWSLACQAPDVFKATASVTGTMSGPDWIDCDPSSMIPVMQISGTNDNVVPMDGSMAYESEGWGGAPDIYTIMNFWSDLHGCTDQETINFQFDYSTDVTQYFNCTSNTSTELRLYVANGMGHTWPNFANEQIWDFFMQIAANPLDLDSTLESTKSIIKKIDILGKNTNNNGYNIEIFDNGKVIKKYIK